MNPTPFKDLIQSRRFWLLVLSQIVSTVMYFGSKYATPSTFEDIKFLITGLDGLAGLIIVMITAQNITQIKKTGDYKPPVA